MKTRLKVDWKDVRFTCKIIFCTEAAAADPTEALSDKSATKTRPARPATVSFGDPGDIGIGTIVGETTGLTLEAWLSEGNAIDTVLGWYFHHDGSTHFCGDYLGHVFDLIQVNRGKVPANFGPGCRALLEHNHDNRAGIDGPAGVACWCDQEPIEVIAGPVPIIDPVLSALFDLNGGAGVRH